MGLQIKSTGIKPTQRFGGQTHQSTYIILFLSPLIAIGLHIGALSMYYYSI